MNWWAGRKAWSGNKRLLDELETILTGLGEQLMQWRNNFTGTGQWEGAQFKSDADRRAHRILHDKLQEAWPGIPVISEEDITAHGEPRPQKYWLIDPIDGTASYCGGFDGFVTQAALMENDKPVLGVVQVPALGLTYRCIEGQVPLCNNAPVHANGDNRKRTLIDNYPEPRGIAKATFSAMGFDHYVESGSIALKICRVAEGSADLFVKDVTVSDWDLAPAHLILEGAGGMLSTFKGAPIIYHDAMIHEGLVATCSQALAAEFQHWRKSSISKANQ